MNVWVLNPFMRRRRIDRLVERLGDHEAAMRDLCAQLIELTEEGDDLHVEIRRLLEQLDG